MRVLVTGSRDWPSIEMVFEALSLLYSDSEPFVLVHGKCPTGADLYAQQWADEMNLMGYLVEVESYAADWKRFKKAAGYRRNAEMVKLGADICLAFIYNGSQGATHCSGLAVKAGIETQFFRKGTTMVKKVWDDLKLEDIRMIWRNFRGEKQKFNEKGVRKFAIPLDDELAHELAGIGWNVKERTFVNDEGVSEIRYHLPVTVKLDSKIPPRLFLVSNAKNNRTSRTLLDEETIGLVDFLRFDAVHVVIRPFNFDVNGNQGVSAYLKTMFAFVHEDPLELKYAYIPIEGADAELEDLIDAQEMGESHWVDDADDEMAEGARRKEIEP